MTEKPEETWKGRTYTLSLIDAKRAEGVSYEEIAQALGLDSTYSLKRGYRYDKRHPSRNGVSKLADYFKVSEDAIWLGQSEDDDLATAKAFVTDAMGSDITSKLTDAQILRAFKMAMNAAKSFLEDEQK